MMSMQKLVVNAVVAESALENAEAMIPMAKHTSTTVPISPCAMKSGSNESPLSGKEIPPWA